MTYSMLSYYFLKQVLDVQPNRIKEKLEYDKDLLFNLSTFNDLGSFYRLFQPLKKDKYKLHEMLQTDTFHEFIYECILICKKNNDYNQLLFIYAMVSSYVLKNHILPYLSVRLSKKLTYTKACTMIDYYYASSRDSLNLTKLSLSDYFPTAFTYYDWMEELIHKPFIKTFKFFCTKPYFMKCYKKKRFYFTYCTRSKTKLKLIPFKLYDWILNHRGQPKASHYIYTSKISTSLFNLNKKPYLVGEETYNYCFDDIISNALSETKQYTDAINLFISFDQEKPLLRMLHIECETKK